jgi:heme-degrading monooxygenase HmoA
MYTRLLTFRGATDIDGGINYLRDEVLPVLHAQHGYHGVSASADRPGALLGVLSLWESEADRSASESGLGKARQEAAQIVGGDLTVENFELLVEEIVKPPVAGCALIVTRIRTDPASIEDNLAFFTGESLPQIKSKAGFCAVRNMFDRESGRGVVGTVWEDRAALEAFAVGIPERRAAAVMRGISFDETSYRDILFTEIK